MDSVTTVSVEQVEPGRYQLGWRDAFADQRVSVRAAARPADLPASAPLERAAHGLELALGPGRWYFLLEPEQGDALVVAERGLPFAGGTNFRDVGGYATAHGTRVAWGRLFRSGHMTHLTADDKALFATLDIRTVIDFRMAAEREHELTELPGDPKVHVLGIPPGVGSKAYLDRVFAEADGPEPVVAAMHAILRGLVRECAPYYGRLFEILLDLPPGAVLLNCSAGKERTGVGVALLLSALGVPRETIMYDFMLSKRYFPAEREIPRVFDKYHVKRDGEAGRAIVMPLLETRASFLEVVLDAIDEDHGSSTAYLEQQFGLGAAERARLAAVFTV